MKLKMVLSEGFSNIINEINKNATVSLPSWKENGLNIEYFKGEHTNTVYSNLIPLPFAKSEVFNADISSWRRLTGDGAFKPAYEVTFNVKGSDFEFKGGDTIGIIPHNIPSDVNVILNNLDLKVQADTPYHLSINKSTKGCKIPPHIPVKSTLKHVLTYCVDLRAVLKKLFLLALSRYTKDVNERRILEFLCSKEGATAYQTYILNRKLTLVDIFNVFETCKPPIEILFSNLPRLLPRPYSIVNTGTKESNFIKICFSVMNISKNRKGLTTGWLESFITKETDLIRQFESLSIDKNVKVPLYLRINTSGFNLPSNLETPMILIGPGTGVAPYLGFLEELKIYKENHTEAKVGEVWLYFGCRDAKLDFIYEKELCEFLKAGVLTKLRTAFSRMDGSEFKYIQDALKSDAESIVKLIKDGAHIFICGDLNTMVVEVKEILVNSLVKYDGISKEEAEKWICDMQKDKRYLVDAWS